MSDTQLFGEWNRSDTAPMRHVETVFGFLDRVHRSYFARVRAMLNDWVSRYPPDHGERLIRRLRSEGSEQQLHAFWELYIHEVMRAAGWTVTVEPAVPGTRHVPDFLCSRDGISMYIEATSSNRSPERVADDNRLARVMDELTKLGPADFALWVDCDRSGPDSPPISGLRDELLAWRGGLSRDDVLRAYARGGFHALPVHEWKRNGWELSFTAYAWGDGTVGDPGLPAIGAEGRTEITIVDHTTPMQRAFKAKRKKYGTDLGHPFVLAYLNTHDFSASDLTHLNALSGPLLGGPDGCWYARGHPVNRDVAAVIAVWNLRPSRVLGSIPAVFRNPWANTPLTAIWPWPTIEFDPSGGTSSRAEPGTPLAQLLNISDDFAGVSNPFDVD